MLKFLIRRCILGIFSLLIISFFIFFLTSHVSHLISEDRLEAYEEPYDKDMGSAISDTRVIYFEFEEKNWLVRYGNWLKYALRGRFGYSLSFRMPVWEIFNRFVTNTLVLTLTAFVLSWGVSIPLGIYSAIHNNKLRSKITTSLGIIGISLPEFFLALLAIYFAFKTQLFPVGGIVDGSVFINGNWFRILLSYLHHLILPSMILASMNIARTFKIVKGEMLEQLGSDYMIFAESKGLPKKYLIRHHAFRNCMNPLITNLGMQFGTLLTGSLFVEFVFSINGIGATTIRALSMKDQPLAVASLLASALLLIFGNIFADIFLAYIDPRIRLRFFK